MMKRTLLRSIFTDDSRAYDKKLKLVDERVNVAEKNIPELKQKISNYICKKSAERKLLTKLSVVLSNYANAENVCSSVKLNVESFANIISELGDHEEIFVQCLENDVLITLDEFSRRCKFLRNDVKTAQSAANRELDRQRQLQRFEMLRDQDEERVSVARADFLKAKAENAKSINALEEHADIFEQEKLRCLRTCFLDWISHELRFHARALELFTDAYQVADCIDVTADLEKFRDKMYSEPKSDRLSTVMETSNEIRPSCSGANFTR